jgi:hypothetical protein
MRRVGHVARKRSATNTRILVEKENLKERSYLGDLDVNRITSHKYL